VSSCIFVDSLLSRVFVVSFLCILVVLLSSRILFFQFYLKSAELVREEAMFGAVKPTICERCKHVFTLAWLRVWACAILAALPIFRCISSLKFERNSTLKIFFLAPSQKITKKNLSLAKNGTAKPHKKVLSHLLTSASK
jgi:hypothetical protein